MPTAIPPHEKKRRFELVESIMLSIAVLGTAWSAYQSSRWNSLQTFQLSDAGAASRKALEKHLLVEQQFTIDAMLTLHLVDHYVEGKSQIVEFYESRYRPELRAAVEAWLALKPLENPNTPAHPLAMPGYVEKVLTPARAEVSNLRDQAEQKIERAHISNHNSDRYVLFTVLLASVLFFTGIAGKFDPGPIRVALLSLAGTALAVVVVQLAMSPVARS